MSEICFCSISLELGLFTAWQSAAAGLQSDSLTVLVVTKFCTAE